MNTHDALGRPARPENPCDHFAAVGYAALLSAVPPGRYEAADCPQDSDEDESPGSQDRWCDLRVLEAIADGPPAPKKTRRKAGKPAEAAEREPAIDLAGHRVDWHRALIELKVWAGQASLATIVSGRQATLRGYELPVGTRLIDWRVPYSAMSGLDPATAATNLDIGFAPAAHGMPVMTRAAAELLMVLGLQLAPVTRFGPREYGYTDRDGRWWRFRVVKREGYHRMLTTAEPVRWQVAPYVLT